MTALSDTFAQSEKSAFETTYLAALRAIMACREAEACGQLNAVKSILNGQSGLAGQQENPTVELIKSQLRSGGLDPLYGDFKSDANTPWIKSQKVMSMISAHVMALGTKQDTQDFAGYAKRSAATFHQPTPAARLA